MNYLGIDTSGAPLAVLLRYGGRIYEYTEENCGTRHSAALMPAVRDLLRSANASLKDIDVFACVTGPGSFTGIRIGVSTVKAFCFAEKKPCLAITSFDALAYDVPNGTALCAVDARHGAAYVRLYENFRPAGEAKFAAAEEFSALCEKYPVAAAYGAKGLKYSCNPAAGFRRAIEAKAKEAVFDTAALAPLYVRASQAEEGR